MAYHTAKQMLRAAAAEGFTFKVWGGDPEPDFAGPDPMAAWQAVADTDSAEITLHHPDGTRVKGGWAYLMVDGPGNCDPQETVVDHSAEGWIADWWNTHRDQILA